MRVSVISVALPALTGGGAAEAAIARTKPGTASIAQDITAWTPLHRYGSESAVTRESPIPLGLAIAGSLQLEKLRVLTAERHELPMRTLLDDAAVLKNEDPVGHPHGREPVRD